jgi:hypothetical protein
MSNDYIGFTAHYDEPAASFVAISAAIADHLGIGVEFSVRSIEETTHEKIDARFVDDPQEVPMWLTKWIEQVFEVVIRVKGKVYDETLYVAVPVKNLVVLA